MHKQTNRQTNRHYENNGHLAVNQLEVEELYASRVVSRDPLAVNVSRVLQIVKLLKFLPGYQ